MQRNNFSSYEELIKQLVYKNKIIESSREYTFGKRLLMILRFIKQCKFITLCKLVKDNLFFSHVAKKFIDLPNTKLTTPLQTIPTIEMPQNTPAVTIYTCITGNYDQALPPLVHYSNCKYILFTDNPQNFKNTLGWDIQNIPRQATVYKNLAEINRYLKFHPQEICDTNYSIYVDGNIQLLAGINEWLTFTKNPCGIAIFNHSFRNCLYREGETCIYIKRGNVDGIKKQLVRYEQEGMPRGYGLKEASVIVSDLSNIKSIEILKLWWEEYLKSGSGRDQLALPYVLWKNNIPFEDITSLGENLMKDIHLARKIRS